MRLHSLPFTVAVAATAIQGSSALVSHHSGRANGKALSATNNVNGVPYGSPDKEIKCAFFRAINPRTDTYLNFREDVEKEGLAGDLIDGFAWPMIYIQQGAEKSLEEGVGLNTSDLDGYVEGVLSHKDLMWPHRTEVADFLAARKAEDGTIHAKDVYDGKAFAAKKYKMRITIASFLEIPLVFLKCGGNADTGRVPLKSILEFYSGEPPSTEGKMTSEGLRKVLKALGWRRKISGFWPNVLKLPFTKGFRTFLSAMKMTSGEMQEKLGVPK